VVQSDVMHRCQTLNHYPLRFLPNYLHVRASIWILLQTWPPDLTSSDSVDAEGPDAFGIKQDKKIKSMSSIRLQNYPEGEELIKESTQTFTIKTKREE
jgi:hypothetical protein